MKLLNEIPVTECIPTYMAKSDKPLVSGYFNFMERFKNKSLQNLVEEINGIIYTEEWKDVIGYEGLYQVSTFGRIKSLNRTVKRISKEGFFCGNNQYRTTKILYQRISNTKRLGVTLCKNNIPKQLQVSRIVALNFIPNPENKAEVNHISGNYQDNFYLNLEWNTSKENNDHATINGLRPFGKRNSSNVLSEKQVIEIFNSELKLSELAKIYNVHYSTCGYIKNGTIWAWLTGGKQNKKRNRKTNSPNEN